VAGDKYKTSIARISDGVKDSGKKNKGVPVEFLVLHDVDLIISRVESNMHIEEIQEDGDEDMGSPDMGNTFCDAPFPSPPHSSSAPRRSVKFQ